MTVVATPTRQTFKQRVAACFEDRPSLRDVLSHEGFQALADRYPWIRSNHSRITSLDAFVILHAASGTNQPVRQSILLDELLGCFITREPVQLRASDQLSISPPDVFHIQERGLNSRTQPEITADLSKLNTDFDAILATLVEAYQQAQIGYWNGLDEVSQVSRMLWMELTIKATLLENLPRQDLEAGAKMAVFELLDGSLEGLTVEAVNVTLDAHGGTHAFTLPDLLLTVAHGSDAGILQCKPCGTLRKHADLPSFAAALQTELAQRYQFETMSWAHTSVIGRPFAFQARQLLNGILDDIASLRIDGVTALDALERQLRQASDPSTHFLDQPLQEQPVAAISPPAWLANASADDRYAYHDALLDLAVSQGQSKGATSLGDIEDIHRYTARRLQEQLQASHPDKTAHDPDQVFIRISQSIVGSGTQGQSLFLRRQSLTDLAISRVRPEAGEVMTGISIGEGEPTEEWLSIEQVRDLIHQVDIGGQYPGYLQNKVKAEPRRAERIRQHAREWRYTLRFSTLKAKIEQRLGEPASQALLDFCKGSNSATGDVRIAPLAFHCAPGASASDVAHGMFIIEIAACRTWALYRPFYADQAIQAFATLEMLMAAIRAKGELQESVLAWLDDEARPVYENDGFNHPHLHPNLSSLLHLISTDGELVDALLQRLRRPVEASFQAWTEDLDTQLFDARINAMLLAASSTSVSNAQEKRALVKEAVWALFNTVTQFWHGPLASLVWLVLALSAARQDVQALLNGSGENRIVALTDLLTNLALLLAHRIAPPVVNDASPTTLRFSGPVQKGEFAARVLEQPEVKAWESPVETPRSASVRVHSWHDEQRLGNLSEQQRQALSQLQARVSLDGQLPLVEGRLRGLFKVAGRYYVKLGDGVYEAMESWNGMQVIGPEQSSSEWVSEWGGAPDDYHIVGRERQKGPWLARRNGTWALNLHLAGGMPKSRASVVAEKLKQFNELDARTKANKKKLEDMEIKIKQNTDRLQAYDDLALAYSLAFDALPALERASPPEALHRQKQELKAARMGNLIELRASALYLERQSTLLYANIEAFKEMSKPRFSRLDPAGQSQSRYGSWFDAAIDNDMLLCRRLLEQVDHQALAAQATGLQRFPETAEQIGQYTAYRDLVRDSCQASRRLLVVSERLDLRIPEALQDSTVDFANKITKLNAHIRRRTYSTLVVRAQLLSDLAYLAVDKLQLTADTAEYLLTMRAPLSDAELSRTIWSHDGLPTTDVTTQVKAEVLEDILQKYCSVRDRARYMQTLDDPALVTSVLAEYTSQLETIVQITEQQLGATLATLDSGINLPPPTPVHRLAPARRKVIRIARGRPQLVEVDPSGNQAIQRNAFSLEPARRFSQRNGEWYEEPVKGLPTPPGRRHLRKCASRLLAEVEGKIAFAARFANEPNSLADFLEWPIDDMREVRQRLGEQSNPLDGDLMDRLQAAADRVAQERRRLLTDAYLNSRHPGSRALRFLAEQNRIRIRQTVIRRQLRHANDYLDVYAIRDAQAPQRILWEAHFHYPGLETAGHDFVKGHLKFWDAGVRGRDAMLEQAANARERIAIYRGDLRLEQVVGIIPFPADPPR